MGGDRGPHPKLYKTSRNVAPWEEKKLKDATLSPSLSLSTFPSSLVILYSAQTPKHVYL